MSKFEKVKRKLEKLRESSIKSAKRRVKIVFDFRVGCPKHLVDRNCRTCKYPALTIEVARR